MPRQASVPLIICFGDSLTAGYQSPTPDFPEVRETPYGAFLQERLAAAAQVLVSGVCGELTSEMLMRFRRDVLAHQPHSVVILGGTNDLGWNADPSEIMRNLLKMFEQALAAGVQPVAVTVPSIRPGATLDRASPDMRETHLGRRLTLNRLLRDYCARRGLACIDLFTATAEPASLQLAVDYSNDGLHMTTEGYQKLADLLYEEVFFRLDPSGKPTTHSRVQ
jgi:lysophospholipase L1-like esterase